MLRVVANLLTMWPMVAGRAPPLPPKLHRDVMTTQGAVRGYYTPNPPHYAYLGLPYGRPPTRHDRFKTPEPLPRWDGIFEGTHRVKCPQPNGAGEENCLVVNVFTPQHGINLPIVVIVHDGGFDRGWGDFEPPHNLINQRFIIITFNYRLGVFGFLCLGVPEAPGNMGLKDQVAALYWIKRNIINFGGNPNDITVYGIGSGAVSVQMLLASGPPRGLFHKAILESGSMLSPGTFTYEPILDAFNAATVIGYNGTRNAKDLIRFYKMTPTRVLIKIHNKFLACIESNSSSSALLYKDPIDSLKEENSYDISLLFTYNTNGIKLKTNIDIIKSSLENFENLLPNNLQFPNEVIKLNIANIIKEFYFNRNGEDILSVYKCYISDIFIVYPVIKLATMFASVGSHPIYLMEFSYNNNTNNKYDSIIDSNVDIFNYISTNSPLDEDKVIERLVMLYANFINIGDPTPLTTFLLPKIWQPIRNTDSSEHTLSSIPCLHFGSSISTKECSLMQQLALWDKLYKRFYRKIYRHHI